jgi:hypothetical protein
LVLEHEQRDDVAQIAHIGARVEQSIQILEIPLAQRIELLQLRGVV